MNPEKNYKVINKFLLEHSFFKLNSDTASSRKYRCQSYIMKIEVFITWKGMSESADILKMLIGNSSYNNNFRSEKMLSKLLFIYFN